MLTQQDIDDLKLYVDDYENFCKSKTCDDTCEVLQKSKEQKISCWKAFCAMKHNGMI